MQTSTIYIIVGVVAVALLLMVSSQFLTSGAIGSITTLGTADHIEGNKDASVVLIEYGDYQCPACAQYHPIVKEALAGMEQTVAFSFRHFPLQQHAQAVDAAYAAEAAGIQGKYWEMHNALYENQNVWAGQTNARDHFIAFAKDLKLDVQKFQNDLDTQAVKEKVQNDFQGGLKAGVNQTPTFFINGKKIDAPKSAAEFKTLLQNAGVSTATTTAQ
jgi:protein-disulfide isomerase